MFKFSGVCLDVYDDRGATLKALSPDPAKLPDFVKTANIRPKDQLMDEDFALTFEDNGYVFQKYAMNDRGTAAISVIYFMEHSHKLPSDLQKTAAMNLLDACLRYDLEPPHRMLELIDQGQGEKVATLGGITGYIAQGDPDATPRSGFWRGVGGGMVGSSAGAVLGGALGGRQGSHLGAVAGDIAGGYIGGQSAKATPEELAAYKAKKPSNDNFFAVGNNYPIDSWDEIKQASDYWVENRKHMDAVERREFAVKTASRAQEVGVSVPDIIKEAGAVTYANQEHIESALDKRRTAFNLEGEDAEYLDKLASVRDEVSAEKYASYLHWFDVQHGFDRYWGAIIPDPFESTYGINKVANIIWQDGTEMLTEQQLQTLSENSPQILKKNFGSDFLMDFRKNPKEVFESMPDPVKKQIARMADSVTHDGRSEAGRMLSDEPTFSDRGEPKTSSLRKVALSPATVSNMVARRQGIANMASNVVNDVKSGVSPLTSNIQYAKGLAKQTRGEYLRASGKQKLWAQAKANPAFGLR